MIHTRILDCLGEVCPTPIIELSKAIKELGFGESLLLLADDPATLSDLHAWSRMTGHKVAPVSEKEFTITKG